MAVTYTPLPPAPVPGNRDFEVRAGAFLDAMPVFGAEMKAIADAVSEAATVVDVEGNATIAATAASQASIAATAATTQVNAVKLDVGKAAAAATAAARSATAAALSASQSATNALASDQNAARAEAAAELADSDGNASVAQAAAATAIQKAGEAEKAAQTAVDASEIAVTAAELLDGYEAGTSPGETPHAHMLGSMAFVDQTWLHGYASWDPPSVPVGQSSSLAIAVPGAELGDFAMASSAVDSLLILTARVSAAHTVTVTYTNTGTAPADESQRVIYVVVLKRISK